MRKFARLIVLGVAIAAGGSAAWLANGLQPAEQAQTLQVKPQVGMVDVMVAAKDLPAGSKISDTECDWQAWPEDAVVKGMVRKSEELAQNDPVKGSISRVAMFRGEPIRREKLVKGDGTGFLSALLPAGRRAIAINIDAQGGTTAGGFILPNDRVDVIRTSRDLEKSKAAGMDIYTSETILTNVRVLAIGQNVQDKNGEKVVAGATATLELDPKQANTIILAQRIGQLSLALRSIVDASRTEQVRSSDEDGITVTRYAAKDATMTVTHYALPTSASTK